MLAERSGLLISYRGETYLYQKARQTFGRLCFLGCKLAKPVLFPRLFWNRSRLADLPCQPYAPPSHPTPTPRQLLVLPVPSLNLPMLRSDLLDLITACQSPIRSVQTLISSTSDASMETDQAPSRQMQSIEYEPDGLLFVVASALYESGPSCLAAWVAVDSPTLSQLHHLVGAVEDPVACMEAD